MHILLYRTFSLVRSSWHEKTIHLLCLLTHSVTSFTLLAWMYVHDSSISRYGNCAHSLRIVTFSQRMTRSIRGRNPSPTDEGFAAASSCGLSPNMLRRIRRKFRSSISHESTPIVWNCSWLGTTRYTVICGWYMYGIGHGVPYAGMWAWRILNLMSEDAYNHHQHCRCKQQ